LKYSNTSVPIDAYHLTSVDVPTRVLDNTTWFNRVYKVHNLNFVIGSNPNEHRMEIENGILCMLNAEVTKKANINVKKNLTV